MLLRKNRSRDKIYHLFSFLNRLKCRPDGDLGFTVSHIPADKPVHDLAALHIVFRIFNRLNLILCLFKGEHLLKFLLPYSVRSVDKSFRPLPYSIELNEIFRDSLNRFSDLTLSLSPLDSSQLIQLGLLCIRSRVFLNQIHLGDRNIEHSSICVGNL